MSRNISISEYGNKYVYVKQNVINFQPRPTNKVLINPNFKRGVTPNSLNVYVNPNFSKIECKHNIHVNPNLLQPPRIKSENVTVPSLPENKKLVSTRTKLVRVPCNPKQINNVEVPSKKPPKQIKVNTKYKFIKADIVANADKANKPSETRTKFKIDKRYTKIKDSKSLKRICKKIVLNKGFNTNKVLINNQVKAYRSNFVHINGVLYKRSPHSLKRSNSFETKRKRDKLTKSSVPKASPICINHRLSTRFSPRNPFTKINLKQNNSQLQDAKKVFAIQNLKKFKAIQSYNKLMICKISPSKLKKCNIPCPFYRKFGRCRGKDKGTCNRVHNPDQISICPKFLQGSCIKKSCLLSHKVSAEKMPTCKYFLEGMCSREDCPYLHVKISQKSDICLDFLQGFCKMAEQCDKRHQFLCPEFEKKGSCLKQTCPYPHLNTVRKSTSKLQLPIRYKTERRRNNKIKTANRSDSSNSKVTPDIQSDKNCNTRYYVENAAKSVDSGKNANIEDEIMERQKIGTLPSFIPFDKL